MKETLLATPLGELSFSWQDGNLRSIKLEETEVIRGIGAPVRDEFWGTCGELETGATLRQFEKSWCATRTTGLLDGRAEKIVNAEIRSDGDRIAIRVDFELTAKENLASNRAGFCVLHPLQGVKGCSLEVTHSDGSRETTEFPKQISPGQPVQDIVALTHEVGDVGVNIEFDGEVFEMEDQRNWSDASFKTYCRPLSLPLPIQLAPGESVKQSITIELRRIPGRQPVRVSGKRIEGVRLPEIFLAVEPDWLGPLAFTPDGIVMRVGGDVDWAQPELERLRSWIADHGLCLDLEIVVSDPENEIRTWANRLTSYRLFPRHVTALPSAYLKSYQPEGPWPDAPHPEDLLDLLETMFPEASLGTGMLTYFTEFNRRPPKAGPGDFITYSTSAIVHAADSASVLETLEALPDIFESAAALAPGKRQRLGLIAIAMRSNPYGAELTQAGEGPASGFIPMTSIDRRHKEAAGAAFGTAATMLSACAGIDRICLGSTAGPFGLCDNSGAPTPLARAIVALRDLGGRDLIYEQSAPNIHELRSGDTAIIAHTDAQQPRVVVRKNSKEETIR